VFSDTLDDTPEEIRSQEPMKVTISRKAEIISALLWIEIGEQFAQFAFGKLGSGPLPWCPGSQA